MNGPSDSGDSLFGKRIGSRLLVCPECTTVVWDAGPGGAVCAGQGDRPHEQLEMWGFTREEPTP